ncbi:MAG: OmpA family protein [Bacteroidetes bacterium]|nr:OmpA family protein [Bacteroidota bacterium]
MKKLLLLFIMVTSSLFVTGQTIDKKWNIGFHGGAEQYNGDLGNGFYKTDLPFYGFGGVSFSRYLGSHVDLNLLFTKGEIGHRNDTVSFRTGFSTVTLNLRFNILRPQYKFRPYILAGAGAMLFAENPTVQDKSKIDYSVPSAGAGFNIQLSPNVMLNIQELFLYSTNDNKDGFEENTNDAFLMHTVGLTFNAGNKKDADKDGVADRNDKCADTPPGVEVDKNGCPVDTDKDGVANYQDACPDIAGVFALKGCPDTDGDGIADKEDSCPQVAGLSTLNGCPDTDKDGITDLDDKCAGTDPKYKVDATGCPIDNDKDGIFNEDDLCPELAGNLAMKGCPDTDGDGVADNEDRCPTVKGNIANKGCPEITKEDVKKITQIASKIFFELNSDKLKVASTVQLDELANILKKYDAANLIIEGHTDSQGEDEYNMSLSQKRTESVKMYLMGKGIMESRLTATGFGESKPIADNKTADGRAKNRRVELKTEY